MTASPPAVLSVDLNALARNYRTLEAVSGQPVHPVVKADGYGLGAQAVATRLMAEGAAREAADREAAIEARRRFWRGRLARPRSGATSA